MSRSVLWNSCYFLALCGLAVGLVGCGQKAPTPGEPESATSEASTDPASTKGETPAGGQRGLTVRPNVTTFPGRWGLVVLQPIPDQNGNPAYRELCICLLEFTKSGDGLEGQSIATMPQFEAAKISAVTLDGPQLGFQFHWNDQNGDFEGNLADGIVRGSLLLNGMGLVPAMLRPTEEKDFEGWDPMPLAQGRALLNDAAASKEQPNAILTAARELRGTALSLQAYDAVLSRLRQYPDLTEKQLGDIHGDILASAEPWGERIVAQSRFKTAMGFTMIRRVPALALKLIDEAEASTTKLPDDMVQTLAYARDQANVDLALSDIKLEDADKRAAAQATLQELLPKQRYNPEILNALGTYALAQDDKKQALEYFADIVSLPMLEQMLAATSAGQPPGDPSAREQLLKLWEDEHGTIEGFEEFLSENYHTRMAELSEVTRTKGMAAVADEERKRLVLVELFTGTGCPPCVAADVAAEVVGDLYPQEVVVLQYHEHIPAPDPLTNQDSEDRMTYYSIGGTPSIFVDGLTHPPEVGVGGFLQSVGSSYEILRSMVDFRMKQEPTGELSLSSQVDNNDLFLNAVGSGYPEDQLKNLRMRLAIVDNEIVYTAANGIRTHHYVVREMPGGAKGLAARDGKFEYSLQMPFADIEQHLNDYLNQFEAGRNLSFPGKPTKLGSLSLVGWVQNDETHEILRAVMVPIAGTGGGATPEATSPEAAPPEAKDPPASAESPANAPK